MLGLEFSPAALVNAFVGGTFGAMVALVVAWWSTRKMRDQIAALANFLEWERDGKRPEFVRDVGGRVAATKGHGETVAGGSVRIRLPTEEEERREAERGASGQD